MCQMPMKNAGSVPGNREELCAESIDVRSPHHVTRLHLQVVEPASNNLNYHGYIKKNL